jgi:hypothetical protein
MKILTVDNIPYDLNKMPETVSEDMAFSVLDNSNPKEPDFFFLPLIYIESFNAPAIVLDIGGKEITMPLDWSIAVGDKEDSNTVEVVPLTSIADRGFSAFIFNPLQGFKADFFEVNVVNFYNDVKWYFPKMRSGQLLCIPLENKPNPLCAYFVKDINRQSEIIDFGKLL